MFPDLEGGSACCRLLFPTHIYTYLYIYILVYIYIYVHIHYRLCAGRSLWSAEVGCRIRGSFSLSMGPWSTMLMVCAPLDCAVEQIVSIHTATTCWVYNITLGPESVPSPTYSPPPLGGGSTKAAAKRCRYVIVQRCSGNAACISHILPGQQTTLY